jgi:hypothetical protein
MGPPNALKLVRQGARFVFWMPYRPDDKVVSGSFRVLVPRGKIVQWDVRKIQAMLQSGHPIKWGYYPHSLVVRDWDLKGRPDRKVELPTELSGARYTSSEYPVAWYYGWLEIETHLPDTFYLKIPKMKINGAAYPSFTIEFHKAHGLFWGPINGC